MCLVALAWHAHPTARLVLVANRDEFHARATAPMDWWTAPRLLAGRDLEGGGTWLGVGADARFGVITNLRGAPPPAAAPSRGTLIPRYLASGARPAEFAATLAAEAHQFAGFSLLIGDARELWYVSNGDPVSPRALGPGVHGLSNGTLAADWPKVRRSCERLAARLGAPLGDPEQLLALIADRTPAPDGELPDTGVGLDLERALSAPFVVGERYGTRAATAVVLGLAGRGEVVERSHGADGAATGTRRFRF